jgi:hypothetical protein
MLPAAPLPSEQEPPLASRILNVLQRCLASPLFTSENVLYRIELISPVSFGTEGTSEDFTFVAKQVADCLLEVQSHDFGELMRYLKSAFFQHLSEIELEEALDILDDAFVSMTDDWRALAAITHAAIKQAHNASDHDAIHKIMMEVVNQSENSPTPPCTHFGELVAMQLRIVMVEMAHFVASDIIDAME